MAIGPLSKPNHRVEIFGDYVAIPSDRIIAVTSLELSLSITLPDAALSGPNDEILVKDETGLASGLKVITITSPSGVIEGLSAVVIVAPFGMKRFYSSGENWFMG